MKVFLSVTSLRGSYGGPAYSVSRAAIELASQDLRVGLWTPDGSAMSTPQVPHDSGVLRLSGPPSGAIDSFCPDVIHDNGIWLRHNHELAGIAKRRSIARVVSVRGMLAPWALNHKWIRKRVAWTLYQKRDLIHASALHASNADEAAHISQVCPAVPVCTIPNGIDLPELVPVPRETSPRVALFVGRIYPVKGLPQLIQAWERVRPPGWKLMIAGPDEAGHLARLQRMVASAKLDDVVSFPGEVIGAEKDRLFRSASLFVLPSHSESFGMAIAEALSYGLPVLTTTATPWPVLENRQCGWRAEPSAESLAECLRAATALPGERLRGMGRNSRQLAAEFPWGQTARNLVRLYENIIAGRPISTGGLVNGPASDSLRIDA